MKLCLPAVEPNLDAAIDARLGRAACFVLVDTESGALVKHVPNAQNKQAASGAGVQAAQTIADLEPDAVACAHAGPKAFRVLRAAGIDVYTGAGGTVREAVAALAAGTLARAEAANVEGHW